MPSALSRRLLAVCVHLMGGGDMARIVEDSFRSYVAQIQRFQPLDRETEQRLAVRWRHQGDLGAAHALVCANLRYVVKIAHGYRGYGLPVPDLVEEGNIGLLEAVKR